MERLETEYQRESWEVRFNQVIERKLCDYRGWKRSVEFNRKMNEKARRDRNRKTRKIKSEDNFQTPSKIIESGDETQKIVSKNSVEKPTWTPSTTKEDVDEILKRKDLKLGTRHKSITTIGKKRKERSKETSNLRPTTQIFSLSSERTVGDRVPYFTGCGTLQRYVHKTQRWRIKLDDGTVEHLTNDQIDFLESCETVENTQISLELVEKYGSIMEEELNNSCYVAIIQKILGILKDDTSFDYSILYDLAMSQNIEGAFDDLDNLDINVVDQILNMYDLQLRYFVPSKTHLEDLKNELLSMYEEPCYLAILCYQTHYLLLGKWDDNFYIYDPSHDYPIRCYYRDVVEFIESEEVDFFLGPRP